MGLGNTNKAFKRGAASTAESLSKKMDEFEKANTTITEEQRKSDAQIREGFDDLYDAQDAADKEKILGEDDSINLKELDEQDRSYLLGTLYSLSLQRDGSLGEDQKRYFSQLKTYLDLENPRKVTLTAISEIEDIDVIKAVYKAVIEFEYLGMHSWDFQQSSEYQDYVSEFRLSQRDKIEIQNGVEEKIRLGYPLEEQYTVSKPVEKDTTDSPDLEEKTEKQEQYTTKDETTDKSNAEHFDKILHLYVQPESAFKNVGKGVEIVQKSRELLYDQLVTSIDLVGDFAEKNGLTMTLDNYQERMKQYIVTRDEVSREKRKAKAAAGEGIGLKKKMKRGGALFPLLFLSDLLSPVGTTALIASSTLIFLSKNPKQKKQYLLDLYRLNNETLGATKNLNSTKEIVASGSANQSEYLLLSTIGHAVDTLLISYNQLPSVDFRSKSATEEEARKRTREYLSKNIFEISNDSGRAGLYKENVSKGESGYLTDKEMAGIVGKVMEFDGIKQEIIGAIDSTLTHSGKAGIVFLEDELIIKESMTKPVRIKYKLIDNVVGDRIILRDEQNNITEQNLGTEADQVNKEKLKLILNVIKSYWN